MHNAPTEGRINLIRNIAALPIGIIPHPVHSVIETVVIGDPGLRKIGPNFATVAELFQNGGVAGWHDGEWKALTHSTGAIVKMTEVRKAAKLLFVKGFISFDELQELDIALLELPVI